MKLQYSNPKVAKLDHYRLKNLIKTQIKLEDLESHPDFKLWSSTTQKLRDLRLHLVLMKLFAEHLILKPPSDYTDANLDWQDLLSQFVKLDKLLIQLSFSTLNRAKAAEDSDKIISSIQTKLSKLNFKRKASLNKLIKDLQIAIDNSWQLESALVFNRLKPIKAKIAGEHVQELNRQSVACENQFDYLSETSSYIMDNFKPKAKKYRAPINIKSS